MTSFVSKYLADAQCNWFGGTAYPAALANVYIALIVTAPTDRTGTSMVECTGGSYARQPISNANLGVVATVGSGTTSTEVRSNSAQLSYTNMPSCTVVGAAAYDAVTGGNFLGYTDLTGGSQVVGAGATFDYPATDFQFIF